MGKLRTIGMYSKMIILLAAVVSSCALAAEGSPQLSSAVPDAIKDIQIKENLGAKVALQEITLKDEAGKNVQLSQYFKPGKPVVLSLVYYECPMLCTFVLNGLTKALKGLEWVPGNQFEVVTVSINPKETTELAEKKKAAHLQELGKPEAASGWHFLTGEEAQVRKLATQIGFGYKYIPEEKQYAHGAAIFVLTPEGKISRYLYGVEYRPQDLKLSLLEASGGKIGGVIDRILLFCYQYDPHTRKYSVYLTRLMQTASAGSVVAFGGYLTVFWNRQRRRRESDLHVQ